jgi:hypothetical protein
MATKRRKAYAGTKREHAQDAQHIGKQLRGSAKQIRFLIKNGRCSLAASRLVSFAAREAQYADARYYSAKVPFQKRYTTYKVVDGLAARFIQKCVK